MSNREFNPEISASFLDADETFASKRSGFKRLLLEIGCGVGYHSIQLAGENPDDLIVAIERTRSRFDRFKRRLEAHPQLVNIHPVHSEAQSWVSRNLTKQSIDELFILYPNPAPKASQKNQRWPLMPFMGYLLECLKEGGLLHFSTNLPDYAELARRQFQDRWLLKCLEDRLLDPKEDGGPKAQSHFERKYLERSEPCSRLCFSKNS